MSTDDRHLMSRPAVRATILASALGAILGMSAESAGAAAFRGSGFGGTHINTTTSKPQTFRTQRTTKSKSLTAVRGTHIVVVRPPPGNGDRPTRHPPPRWHKPPIIVGLPGLPVGPDRKSVV